MTSTCTLMLYYSHVSWWSYMLTGLGRHVKPLVVKKKKNTQGPGLSETPPSQMLPTWRGLFTKILTQSPGVITQLNVSRAPKEEHSKGLQPVLASLYHSLRVKLDTVTWVQDSWNIGPQVQGMKTHPELTPGYSKEHNPNFQQLCSGICWLFFFSIK